MMIPWSIQGRWMHLVVITFIILPIFVFFSYYNTDQFQYSSSTANLMSSKVISREKASSHLSAKTATNSRVTQHEGNFTETPLTLEVTTRKSGIPLVGDSFESGYIDSIDKCQNSGENVKLLIIVTSAPDHFNARTAVRETWGHFALRRDVEVLFMLGRTYDNEVNKKIEYEQNIFQDIIRSRSVDSYNNLTLKTLSMFKWVETYCLKAQFVLKTDDDVFINVSKFLDLITKLDHKVEAIYGHLAKKWKPVRGPKSKYFISKEEYSPEFLPDFTTGPAYLFPTSIAHKLSTAAMSKRYLKLEDVFFNGVIATELNIKRINVPLVLNGWKALKPCNLQRVLTIHSLSIDKQYEAWKQLHSKC